ncbi:2-hydroxyacyl-CoA dehydratase [Clostridium sediminicola]|uniref:2-hydroxyacyl-CoA dehydratase family protein n=1 Tax=Clostridium sediminicola TaxID=3114879 RepID=UPI0031F1E75C
MKKIGLTTTVPVEILIAAGYTPIDLNNLFVTSENHIEYIDFAEREGFPKSMCAWIKGIFGACIRHEIKEIVGVVEGDCSNTDALLEVLKIKEIKIHPFAFPHSHKLRDVTSSIRNFMEYFNVSEEQVEQVRRRLNKTRLKASEIDELTYKEYKVTGFENHILQLCLSDFDGDLESYEKLLDEKLEEIKGRKADEKKIKLGYLGVPPMTGDLHDFVEEFDARFIFNEVQREFAFSRAYKAEDIYYQYYDYTYPYDLDFRIEEIKKAIEERKIDGVIHYTQAFCHKAVEDIVLKKKLNLPMLTIEGDKSNVLDARTKLRIEAFLDMLNDLKGE